MSRMALHEKDFTGERRLPIHDEIPVLSISLRPEQLKSTIEGLEKDLSQAISEAKEKFKRR